ncbi:four helix bundle protein [Dyadobacter sp. BE34]|uniref:Four helix bundle protein n=2 Tax=Dyadobacter TaxID=120831 RepID=A0ABU1R366_9BACT|nr:MULTISPECIES: four helix bundle protein [Dyadobacter]MDR7217628.1 four helix bundle protein [Dyadobacter sp. BE31]MDR6807859.1 four helix bundle protein [Dyadobacter fermentans]MDR7045600.1 four helix bundle protein [Dyadobacter sp. BE242]MDR7199913.1 four helix bundle protein [Dyadobacter sp. BE34]MDR7265804.1 four helix bundle protein [Dyadobacter sp. BE32]
MLHTIMRDFRKYGVWEQSHKLVLELYRLTKSFLVDEKFGLVSQIRRAVVSVPTNICEGCGKTSEREFARFLGISFGSCQEVEYLSLLSKDLGFLDIHSYDLVQSEITSIKKQLYHLIKKLNAES